MMEHSGKKKVKAWKVTALLVVLAACTVVMIYLGNLQAAAFSEDFYFSEYEKLGIRSRFDNRTDLMNETRFLISYMESGEGEIQSGFYNEREKIHMVEVRSLFSAVQIIVDVAALISVVALVLLVLAIPRFCPDPQKEEGREFLKSRLSGLLIGVGAAVDVIAVMFGVMAATFSSSFIRFHELLFRTDTWMLDPATDNLIRMLPEQFFFDIFVKIIMTSVVFATVLLVVGFLMRLGWPKGLGRRK